MAITKRILSLGVCGLLFVSASHASNIAWVSFHPGDVEPSAAAAAAGFTTAPDIGYTSLLASRGHEVTRVVTFDNATPATVSFLNSFDLVIISRSVPSGNYQTYPGEVGAWNGITAPMMVLCAYPVRNSRLGYSTGETLVDTTNTVSLKVTDPTHPIFQGISLDLDNNTGPFAGVVTLGPPFTNTVQLGISTLMSPINASGEVLATVATAGNTFGGTIIAEWETGDASTRGDTFGGPRLLFLTGSREAGLTSEAAGIYDLFPAGRQMFLNAVDYMAVPEPSTAGLFILGGLVYFLRRKK
jgi:hypothetical protein